MSVCNILISRLLTSTGTCSTPLSGRYGSVRIRERWAHEKFVIKGFIFSWSEVDLEGSVISFAGRNQGNDRISPEDAFMSVLRIGLHLQ